MATCNPAGATAFCEVKATRDGFVALRDAPSTGGRLIRRLKAGEMVQLDSTRPNPRGWKAVIFRADENAKAQPGWVSAGLIERECG
ncbi:MAG: SH3 domain-containing protein [Beijerinckiaceae bacterium]|nr:SH3 domain-containing protein [Beijerinckiaceae bacterium]